MRFIGDVHGKFTQYKHIIKDTKDTIQVGDMGVGFIRIDGTMERNPPYDLMKEGNHRFIRGNHDNPIVCRMHSQWIKDGHIEDNMMFIGGALSIDREFRTPNYTWWHDEELSIEELYKIYDIYKMNRPSIMVTHECPENIAIKMCEFKRWEKINDPSRTRQAFQVLLEGHRPKLWIYGHWHFSFDQVIDGTRFVCLAELEHRDINLEEYR